MNCCVISVNQRHVEFHLLDLVNSFLVCLCCSMYSMHDMCPQQMVEPLLRREVYFSCMCGYVPSIISSPTFIVFSCSSTNIPRMMLKVGHLSCIPSLFTDRLHNNFAIFCYYLLISLDLLQFLLKMSFLFLVIVLST